MFIEIENLRIHYRVTGNGLPIILLHGWGKDINYFSKLKDHLAKNFKVYALDLPGFGLSTVPNEVWGTVDYAGIVKTFINELNIVKPILLGHSFGGKVIINLVGDKLVDAKKIVLISSSGVKLPRPLATNLRIYFFKLLKFLSVLPIINGFIKPRLNLYRKRVGSSDYRNSCGIMRKILVKTVNDDVASILSGIKIPTLLLWGDKDDATPLLAGRIMHKAIVGSRLKVIPGSGHFPFSDNWKEVAAELDRFLLE